MPPTGPRSCCETTRAPASCATPTPATSGRWRWPVSGASACRCSTASMADLLVRRASRVFGHEVEGQATIIVRDSRVDRVVAERDLPGTLPGDLPELDAAGRAVIPGFVDAHTHLVFA